MGGFLSSGTGGGGGGSGSDGADGADGTNGQDGADGTSFSIGTGAPSGGQQGDTYLDLSTLSLWSRGASTWSDTGVTLGGEDGDDGAPGGDGDPGADGAGVVGPPVEIPVRDGEVQAPLPVAADVRAVSMWVTIVGSGAPAVISGAYTVSATRGGVEMLDGGPATLTGRTLNTPFELDLVDGGVDLEAGDLVLVTVSAATAVGLTPQPADGVPAAFVLVSIGAEGGASAGTSGGGSTLGTYAAAPASPSEGALHLTTDGPLVRRFDGTAWQDVLPGHGIVTPPVLADFAWVNQDLATAAIVGGVLDLAFPGGGSAVVNVNSLERAVSGAAWEFVVAMRPPAFRQQFASSGVVVRDSSTGRRQLFVTHVQGLLVNRYTSETAYNSTSVTIAEVIHDWHWLRVRLDAGTLRFEVSSDRTLWTEVHSEAETAWLTGGADFVGLALDTDTLVPFSAQFAHAELT